MTDRRTEYPPLLTTTDVAELLDLTGERAAREDLLRERVPTVLVSKRPMVLLTVLLEHLETRSAARGTPPPRRRKSTRSAARDLTS